VLDIYKDRIIRNTKAIGRFSAIKNVEVKAVRPAGTSGAVTKILADGRRIFVETGEPAKVSAIAQAIAQFAGVEVITQAG
jgi:hypothetical protein